MFENEVEYYGYRIEFKVRYVEKKYKILFFKLRTCQKYLKVVFAF